MEKNTGSRGGYQYVLDLDSDMTIDGNFHMNNGYLRTNGHKLTVTGNLYFEKPSSNINDSDIFLQPGMLEVGGDVYLVSGSEIRMSGKGTKVTINGNLYVKGGIISNSGTESNQFIVKGDAVFADKDSSGKICLIDYFTLSGGSNFVFKIGGNLITALKTGKDYQSTKISWKSTVELGGNWEYYGGNVTGNTLVLNSDKTQKIINLNGLNAMSVPALVVSWNEDKYIELDGSNFTLEYIYAPVKFITSSNPSIRVLKCDKDICIGGDADIELNTSIENNIIIDGNTSIKGNVSGNVNVKGNASLIGNFSGNVTVEGNAVLQGKCTGKLEANGNVSGSAEISKLILTSENTQSLKDVNVSELLVNDGKDRNLIVQGEVSIGKLQNVVSVKGISSPKLTINGISADRFKFEGGYESLDFTISNAKEITVGEDIFKSENDAEEGSITVKRATSGSKASYQIDGDVVACFTNYDAPFDGDIVVNGNATIQGCISGKLTVNGNLKNEGIDLKGGSLEVTGNVTDGDEKITKIVSGKEVISNTGKVLKVYGGSLTIHGNYDSCLKTYKSEDGKECIIKIDGDFTPVSFSTDDEATQSEISGTMEIGGNVSGNASGCISIEKLVLSGDKTQIIKDVSASEMSGTSDTIKNIEVQGEVAVSNMSNIASIKGISNPKLAIKNFVGDLTIEGDFESLEAESSTQGNITVNGSCAGATVLKGIVSLQGTYDGNVTISGDATLKGTYTGDVSVDQNLKNDGIELKGGSLEVKGSLSDGDEKVTKTISGRVITSSQGKELNVYGGNVIVDGNFSSCLKTYNDEVNGKECAVKIGGDFTAVSFYSDDPAFESKVTGIMEISGNVTGAATINKLVMAGEETQVIKDVIVTEMEGANGGNRSIEVKGNVTIMDIRNIGTVTGTETPKLTIKNSSENIEIAGDFEHIEITLPESGIATINGHSFIRDDMSKGDNIVITGENVTSQSMNDLESDDTEVALKTSIQVDGDVDITFNRITPFVGSVTVNGDALLTGNMTGNAVVSGNAAMQGTFSGNLTVNGDLKNEGINIVDGNLVVDGNMYYSYGDTKISDGKISVKKDVVLAKKENEGEFETAEGSLTMNGENATMEIGGSLYTYLNADITEGMIFIGKDWYNSGDRFILSDDAKIVLNGEQEQNIIQYDKNLIIPELNVLYCKGRSITYDPAKVIVTKRKNYPETFEQGMIAVGDVNTDGDVNAKDVTQLRRFLAGGWNAEIEESAADINGDSEINAKDVTMLRRYLAGGWGIERSEDGAFVTSSTTTPTNTDTPSPTETPETPTPTEKAATPSFTALLVYGDTGYANLVGVGINNLGDKTLKIGGADNLNVASVYPIGKNGYNFNAVLVNPENPLQDLQYTLVEPGADELVIFRMNDKHYFSKGALIGFAFEYDGVAYVCVVDDSWNKKIATLD